MGFPRFDAFKAGRRGPHMAGKLSAPQSVISVASVVLPVIRSIRVDSWLSGLSEILVELSAVN